MANPIIHPLHDPNGKAVSRMRKRAIDEGDKRVVAAGRDAIKHITMILEQSLVDTIQVNEVQIPPMPAMIVNRTKYIYELSADRMTSVNRFISDIIYEHILGRRDGLWSANWYFNQFVDGASERGTADSLQTVQNISSPKAVGSELSTVVRGIELEQILQSRAYRRPIEILYSRTFNLMKDLSDSVANKLSFQMAQGVADGINIRDIANNMHTVIGAKDDKAARARALRIARTEINNAYTSASMEQDQDLNATTFADSDFEVAQMHMSALAFNTRKWHAERHGTVHTATEQADWWAEKGNRVNCQCSVVGVLRNKVTGEILQEALHKKAIAQGDKYFGRG